MTTVLLKIKTEQFFQNRYRTFWGSDDTNPIQRSFFFFINVEFLYFSMLTWSSLFCVKHNLLQCFSNGGSKVQPKSGSRIVYSQRNDINKKLNSKCFSDAGLLF